jgi:ribonuclease inhibitor
MPLTRIEFVNVHAPIDFYEQVEAQLDIDETLSRNLDALYDLLSADVAGPIELVWHESAFSRTALGDWYAQVLDVLQAVVTERSDVSLSLL